MRTSRNSCYSIRNINVPKDKKKNDEMRYNNKCVLLLVNEKDPKWSNHPSHWLIDWLFSRYHCACRLFCLYFTQFPVGNRENIRNLSFQRKTMLIYLISDPGLIALTRLLFLRRWICNRSILIKTILIRHRMIYWRSMLIWKRNLCQKPYTFTFDQNYEQMKIDRRVSSTRFDLSTSEIDYPLSKKLTNNWQYQIGLDFWRTIFILFASTIEHIF